MRKEAADPIDELVSRVDQAAGWVAHYVPQKALHVGVALMFIILGLWTLKQALPS